MYCCIFDRNMTGIEYMLLHVQDPILYIIRKQYRHSPQQGWFSFSFSWLPLVNKFWKCKKYWIFNNSARQLSERHYITMALFAIKQTAKKRKTVFSVSFKMSILTFKISMFVRLEVSLKGKKIWMKKMTYYSKLNKQKFLMLTLLLRFTAWRVIFQFVSSTAVSVNLTQKVLLKFWTNIW